MTVSSTTNRAMFTGNGTATAFPLPFRFFSNDDIQAKIVDDATGSVTNLTIGIDYTLTGAGDPEVDGMPTGVLTTTTAPASGKTLFVQRIIALTQPTDIVNQGRFFPTIHENVFDRLTMLIQQIGTLIGTDASNSRALLLGDSDVDGSGDYQAKGNQIANLGSAAGIDTNAANFGDVVAYVSQIISAASGDANLAGNVVYALPGGATRTVQERLTDFVSIRDFDAIGRAADGATDWQDVFEAAAASNYQSIYVPPGKYLLSAGNIDVTEKRFWSMAGKDIGTPYGQTGAIIYTTQTTNPVFLLGNGGCIDGLQFFYPDQDGSTITDVSGYPTIVGAPIVYPPTIKGKTSGISGFELRNIVFINAYNCIEIGDQTYVAGTGRGTISNVDAFPIAKFLTIYNGLAEIIVSDFVLSPIVFQDIALTGDAKLRKWSQQNALHFDLRRADGLMVSRGTSLGARRAIRVQDQTLSLARFENVLFDQTINALTASNICSNVTFSDCQFYGGTIYGSVEPQVDLFIFNSAVSAAAAGGVKFEGCQVQEALGGIFNLATANCVSRLDVNNCQFSNWGQSGAVAAPVGAFASAASGVRTNIADTTFFNSNATYGRGVRVFAGTRLKVSDCDFINNQMCVETSGVTQIRLMGNTSENTSAANSIAGSSVIERANQWDNPAVTKVTNLPWFIGVQTTGQTTSGTTPLTMIYQSKNRDGDSSLVAGTGIFTCKTPGSYDFRASFSYTSATAGDVFTLEIVTSLLTYRKRFTVDASGGSLELVCVGADMRVGDTAFVRITRAAGTGVLTTSGAGAENLFSGRLVD